VISSVALTVRSRDEVKSKIESCPCTYNPDAL
jgi:hypothetical protein